MWESKLALALHYFNTIVYAYVCVLCNLQIYRYFFPTGPTEADAKQDALQKALDTLNLLFGFKSLPKCSTSEETEVQVNSLLGRKDQKELIYSHKPKQYKSSVELLFKDYTMESKCEKKKKENVNNLCSRILGLLAAEPGKHHKEVCKKKTYL